MESPGTSSRLKFVKSQNLLFNICNKLLLNKLLLLYPLIHAKVVSEMKLFLLSLLTYLAIALGIAVTNDEIHFDELHSATQPRASKELISLRRRVAESPSGLVVRTTFSNYTSYFLTGPRDYAVVLFFTTSNKQHHCDACPHSARALLTAASAYYNEYPLDSRDESKAARVIFALVDFSTNEEAFYFHKINHVPFVYYLPATRSDWSDWPESEIQNVLLHAKFVRPREKDLDGKQVIDLFDTKKKFKIFKRVHDVASLAFYVTLLFVILGSLASTYSSYFLTLFRQKYSYFFGSLALQAASIGGFLYCIINNAPTLPVSRDYSLVQPGGSQTYIEGGIIGTLHLVSALSMILVIIAAKSKAISNFLKTTLVIGFFCLFIVLYYRIFAYYQMKTTWYKVSEHVPPELRAVYALFLQKTKKWYAQNLASYVNMGTRMLLASYKQIWSENEIVHSLITRLSAMFDNISSGKQEL